MSKKYYKFSKNPRWTGGLQIMRIGYRNKYSDGSLGGFDNARAVLTFRWKPFVLKIKRFWGS